MEFSVPSKIHEHTICDASKNHVVKKNLSRSSYKKKHKKQSKKQTNKKTPKHLDVKLWANWNVAHLFSKVIIILLSMLLLRPDDQLCFPLGLQMTGPHVMLIKNVSYMPVPTSSHWLTVITSYLKL